MINVFNNPQYYRKLVLKEKSLLKYDLNKNNGKSLICVFFTTFCGVGCPFCFFHSPNYSKSDKKCEELQNHFNRKAIKNFIKFANDANVGYLQISGGGEPFLEKEAIFECLEKVNADRIILVTSGFWACNEKTGEKYLNDLYQATLKRNKKARVTIRVSISEYHSIKLKSKPLINLLNIFDRKYRDNIDFTLQLKTFENDSELINILESHFKGYKLEQISDNGTDDSSHIKIMPWKYCLTLKSGYNVIVGKSRLFYSNLRPNLNKEKDIRKSIEVYDKDLLLSQNNNSSIVYNSDGSTGLDWIVEYNGNVCTWQNRIQDNLLNIYEDDYKKILNNTYSDVLTYSYIDKGSLYRENIVNEISPKSIMLMKSVNIRDYVGTLVFSEEKIRLYYTIRVIQDYLKENKINLEIFKKLPSELINAVEMKKDKLIELYKSSTYSVLDQKLNMPINKEEFHDFLELIKLGHYNISKSTVKSAIKYYNFLYDEQINEIGDILHEEGTKVERRLTKLMMTRKQIKSENTEKYFYLYSYGKTNLNIENKIKDQSESIDTKFTDYGLLQINELNKTIKEHSIEAIFSSDLERAKETSKIINESLNLPLYYYKNFRGLNMETYPGKTMEDFLHDENIKKSFADYDTKILGGESTNDLINRFIEGIDNIYNSYNYEKIAIISHGSSISNIKSYISKSKYTDIDYCVIKAYNGKYEIVDFGIYN